MTDWVEIIVPATAVDVDDVAALLADAIEPAREGTEIRGDEVVIWAPLATHEATLAEVRVAVAAFAEAGLGVDPAAVRAQPALPESEWRDAWKRYFHVSRLTRRIVVVPSWERDTFTAAEYRGWLEAAGFQPVIAVTDYEPAREEAAIESLLTWRPAGLLVAGLEHTERATAMLRGCGGRVAELLGLGAA